MSAALRITPALLGPRGSSLADLASAFALASASDLERAALQRRYDRKFLLPAGGVASVLAAVQGDYQTVLAGDERFALYDTFYFDTPSMRSYHDHRRARRPRFKLRIRNYIDRELSMLEYKEKTPRGDTRKLRWRRAEVSSTLTAADEAQLARSVPGLFSEGPLHLEARTKFFRLMLLNTRSVERATLDFSLTLERGGQQRVVDNVVVAEVKDGGRGAASPLVTALRQAHARAVPFSKYCVAVALLGRERSNAFHPTLRALEGGLACT